MATTPPDPGLPARPRYDTLTRLLFALTVATGIVDAVSYLALGHVFVANMTGNVVFVGFAAAGAAGLSLPASLTAVGAFLAGSFAGGVLTRRVTHRGRLVAVATAYTVLLLAAAVVVALVSAEPPRRAEQYGLIVLLAVAMGVQNATARRLGVPDVTTTVLTLTLTGLAAESRLGGGPGARPGRKIASVLTMFAGALSGALLVLHVGVAAALLLALVVVSATSLTAHGVSRGTAAEQWVSPRAR
jgi:uncharacterized membrane protein YoaK (UPF0700 family)